MKIGIDARELGGQPTGVGRYLSEILSVWARLPEAAGHTFLIYTPAAIKQPTLNLPGGIRVVPGSGGTWWEQVSLAAAVRRDAPDVFFAPGYTAPLLVATPTVVTIHDLSFVSHPEWFAPREGMRRRWVTRRAARSASLVLTVSEFSRGEIMHHFGVPDERVRTVYHGVAQSPAHSGDRTGVAREPLVLYVGSIFNRRRVPELIAAFALVARNHPEINLEIVGDNRTWPRQDLEAIARTSGLNVCPRSDAAGGSGERPKDPGVTTSARSAHPRFTERSGAAGAPDADPRDSRTAERHARPKRGRVSIRSYVDQGTLEVLYGRARAFAFLSEYEGFGLAPLDALAAGVPILVLDTPLAREIYGQAALYVPQGDVGAIERGLRSLLFDARAREALMERAPATLARYSWDRAARETLTALEAAARHRPR